jgi:hypothetical protein
MTDLTPRLTRLGDQLERAARRELRPRPRRSRRIALAAVAALVVVPGAAVAGYELISEDEVARSLPAGTLALAGTEPDCTAVREGVEYRCVLARPPAPEVQNWKGTVEPTVDATKHVNGGCRSLNSAGTEWQCYIGREAVRQQIIGPGFLGEYAPGPGVG